MGTKSRLVSFIVALAVCTAVFLLMDFLVMNMQGLSLIFHGA